MILEIRTYRLADGTREEFGRVMHHEAVPLMQEAGIQVVAVGASLSFEDGHDQAYLIRAYPSIEARRQQEDAFYASDAWRTGPREAVLSRVESYHTVVLECSDQAVQALTQR